MAGTGRTEDRRVGRTRRRLKAALLELVRERGYPRITIREIAERADVARSTFYSHYDSKEDLLFAGFDGWLLELAEAEGFSLRLLRHAAAEPRLFQAVMGSRAGARVRRRATELVTEAVRRELLRRDAGSDVGGSATRETLLAARSHAGAGAFLGLAAWWLEEEPELSAEEVDGLFREMAGLRGGL